MPIQISKEFEFESISWPISFIEITAIFEYIFEKEKDKNTTTNFTISRVIFFPWKMALKWETIVEL